MPQQRSKVPPVTTKIGAAKQINITKKRKKRTPKWSRAPISAEEAGEETHSPPKQLMKSLLPSRHVLLEIFLLSFPSPYPLSLPEP